MKLVRFKKKELKDTDIPTASFSDVAFLLIIFFLLTTSLQHSAGFKTELPSSSKSGAPAKEEQKMPEVMISNSKLALNDTELSIVELRKRLKQMRLDIRNTLEEKIVLFSSTPDVSYQRYYEVLAVISSASGIAAVVREGNTSQEQ
jgi:biopolymer transport protein ExbD